MLTMAAAHPGLFGDVLKAERAGCRVVLAGEHWTAYVPAAARWPVEAHLMPHRHVPDFTALSPDERDELAVLYRDLLRRCDALYGTPLPYVAGWHQAPTGNDALRLHLELFSIRRAADKLKYLAGSESGMAAWINDVSPEDIAARLRAAG
jgi:UDPglucose--hexose-1-phosphate uridylyltransferase